MGMIGVVLIGGLVACVLGREGVVADVDVLKDGGSGVRWCDSIQWSPGKGSWLGPPPVVGVVNVARHQSRLDDTIKALIEGAWENGVRGDANDVEMRLRGLDGPGSGGSVLIGQFSAADMVENATERELAYRQLDVHTRLLLTRKELDSPSSLFEIDGWGAVGCAVSHRRVWEALASHPSPFAWAVVVEDDARPVGGGVEGFEGLWEDLRVALGGIPVVDVDMVLLGWRKEFPGPQKLWNGLFRVCGIWHGTHAYIVTRRGAQRLLATHKALGIGSHIDHWLGELNAVSPSLVVLRPPSPLFQSTGDSVLQHSFCLVCYTKAWIAPAFILVASYAVLLTLTIVFAPTLPKTTLQRCFLKKKPQTTTQ